MAWRILIPVALVSLIMSGGLYAANQLLKQPPAESTPTASFRSPNTNNQAQPEAQSQAQREVIAENLYVPWSIVWTSAERLLFTERNGAIKEIVNDTLNPNALITFPEVTVSGEQGLMGLAVDPDYANNKYLYVARAQQSGSGYKVDIIRLIDEATSIRRDKILIANVPAGNNHAGTRLAFGPDKKLYITTGDALNRTLAQDQNSLAGKILRYNPDGSIPEDNPQSNNPLWSSGHRNPQGIAWDTRNNNLWSTEHGPSGFDGPGGGDEVNVIEKGQNYGWPNVSHERTQAGLISPKLTFTPAVAPASLAFYAHTILPEYENSLLFGTLRGESIIKASLHADDPTKIEHYEKLPLSTGLGRIREVAVSPDGLIYFSTSNKDGRGRARENDDKIYRIK